MISNFDPQNLVPIANNNIPDDIPDPVPPDPVPPDPVPIFDNDIPDYNWTPYISSKPWKDFKKEMKNNGYKQSDHSSYLSSSSILYRCIHDSNCKSMYQVKKYSDHYSTNFNNVEHFTECQQKNNQKTKISRC